MTSKTQNAENSLLTITNSIWFQLIEELVAIKILAVLISDAALRVHSLPRWSRSRLDAGVAAY
jgi:hypothetical protein